MGGYGSGRRGLAKTTVEECLTLSAAALVQGCGRAFRHGHRLTWTHKSTGREIGRIGFDLNLGDVSGLARLYYTQTTTGEAVDYPVALTTTPLPWGGVRWWFTCPTMRDGRACGRRVGKLYLPPHRRYFGCRHCHDLTYTSCRESHRFDDILAAVGRHVGLSPKEVARMLFDKKWNRRMARLRRRVGLPE